jgi:hypothetical protein
VSASTERPSSEAHRLWGARRLPAWRGRVVLGAIAMALVFFFNFHVGFVTDVTRANSGREPMAGPPEGIPGTEQVFQFDMLTPRMQVEAFKRGELSLRKTPLRHFHDSSWTGDRLEQIHGLGLPILMLLADIVSGSWLFGGFFPDSLLTLVLLSIVVYVWLNVGVEMFERDRRAGLILVVVGCCWFFQGGFVGILTKVFMAYQATRATSVIWNMICVGLCIGCFVSPTRIRWIALAGACGFAPVIRATATPLAGLIFVVGALSVWRADKSWRRVAVGVGCAAVPFGFLLATNWIRFGHPWRFGYETVLSIGPLDNYVHHLKSPVAFFPITDSLREFFGVVFLPTSPDRFRLPPWVRWDGNGGPDGEVFGVFDLCVLGGAAGAMALSYVRRFSARGHNELFLWGAGAVGFSFLFVFLSRHVARFSYEYVFELYPAFVVMMTAAALRMCAVGPVLGGRALAAIAVYFGAQVVGVLQVDFPEGRNHVRTEVLTEALKLEEALSREPPPSMPGRFKCSERVAPAEVVERHRGFTLYDWARGGDCSVTVATELFLPFRQCVEIVTMRGPLSRTPLRERAQSFLGRAGVDWLALTDLEETPDGRLRVTLCRRDMRSERIELVTIGWAQPNELPRVNFDPVYVESIGVPEAVGEL